MAITFPGSVSTGVQSASADTVVISAHDPSSCDLLIAVAGYNANRNLASVNSDQDGFFTQVSESTRSGSSGDAAVDIWALLAPTDVNHSVTFNWGVAAGPNAAWAALINVSGIDTASVAAATNDIEEQVDNIGSNSMTFSPGGGTSGNICLVAVSVIGDDASTTWTNDESETVLVDVETGGGAGNNDDHSGYVAHMPAPSSPAITWNPTDENAGLLIELVEPSTSVATIYNLLYNKAF